MVQLWYKALKDFIIRLVLFLRLCYPWQRHCLLLHLRNPCIESVWLSIAFRVMVNIKMTLFWKKGGERENEEKPGAMPRKTVLGGQMDTAALWKTRPAWLESGWEKCRSNKRDWSRVNKHELCQLDVSTMPCGLDTLSRYFKTISELCAAELLQLQCDVATNLWFLSHLLHHFRNNTFYFSLKMSSKKSKGVKVCTAAHVLPLLNESICNRLVFKRGIDLE